MFQRNDRRLGNAWLATMDAQQWSDGNFQFTVENPLFSTGSILFSTDLKNWQLLSNNVHSVPISVPGINKYLIIDTEATNAYRFYRITP